MPWSGNSAGPDVRPVKKEPRVRQALDGGSEYMHRHGKRAVFLLVGFALLLGSVGLHAPDGAELEVFDRVAAPDMVYHSATVGDESGLEALRRIYGEALTGFPGIQYMLLASVASEDVVAVRYGVEGVHNGDFRGLPPTGNTITWNHSAFARVECGQITEMWAEVDQLDRLRQFGVLVEEGPAARMAGLPAQPAATPQAADDPTSCDPQSPEDAVAIVDRLRTEVYNEGNLDVMPELFAE